MLVQVWATMTFWYGLRGLEVTDPIKVAGYVPLAGLHPTLVTSAFVHGGWIHLAGNLLFLYITAFNLEDRWGLSVFGPFYLGGAAVSALTFSAFDPRSTIPLVGASGAVAAAMGAFLVCHSRAELRLWYFWWPVPPLRQFLYTGTFHARAFIVLPIWFGTELLFALLERNSNIARSAHVGGFLYGVIFAAVMIVSGMDARRFTLQERKSEVFVEDPDFLAALDRIDQGDLDGARALLEGLLARREHLEARIALARSLATSHDADGVSLHGSRALLDLSQSAPARAVLTYGELRATCPDAVFTDGALARVARSAASRSETQAAFDAWRQLLLHHPNSDDAPRALWEAAEWQHHQQRPDLARRTLENLVDTFPESAFAERARRALTVSDRPPLA